MFFLSPLITPVMKHRTTEFKNLPYTNFIEIYFDFQISWQKNDILRTLKSVTPDPARQFLFFADAYLLLAKSLGFQVIVDSFRQC